MPTVNRLATSKEVADYLQRSEKTLANWRWAGTGPAYIKASPKARKEVRYRWADVEKWLADNTVTPVAA